MQAPSLKYTAVAPLEVSASLTFPVTQKEVVGTAVLIVTRYFDIVAIL